MQLSAKSTALVLIDLQKGILGMNAAPHPAMEVYQRSMKLAQRVRDAGGLVVRVRVSFSAGGVDAPKQPVDQPSNFGSLPPDWDQFPEPPATGDVVITKRQWGAFTGTELDLQLRRRGIRCIVLGGISTNIGVESTARNAWELGYELVIAEDLCTTSSAEMHAFAFKNIFPRLSRAATSEAIQFG
ncbi:MAG TPA: hydrolase [Usitatibacter sp.]|jgi:nicotinamidase-related amidase|nr:hydrolase [Usitatibacter sp.]